MIFKWGLCHLKSWSPCNKKMRKKSEIFTTCTLILFGERGSELRLVWKTWNDLYLTTFKVLILVTRVPYGMKNSPVIDLSTSVLYLYHRCQITHHLIVERFQSIMKVFVMILLFANKLILFSLGRNILGEREVEGIL